MLKIYMGSLPVDLILKEWHDQFCPLNLGALITFVGVVRSEDSIDGLSFDIYEPILFQWFEDWKDRLSSMKCIVAMAHSKGDVLLHQSSFIACIGSKQRRQALELIDEFVEDFKHNAPIWKYDLINGRRIYSKQKSYKLPYSGLLQ